jgi:hypothetical protein
VGRSETPGRVLALAVVCLGALSVAGAAALGVAQSPAAPGRQAASHRPAPSRPFASPTTTPAVAPPARPPPPGPLRVDPTAWAGHGDLAFVSAGRLEILTDSGRLLRVIGPPGAGTDSNPAWSADGSWLAFLHTAPAVGFSVPNPTLWVLQAGASVADEVSKQEVGMFAWSPTAPVLAFTVTAGLVTAPEDLFLDRPGSPPTALSVGLGEGVGSIAWSPGGTELAFDDIVSGQSGAGTLRTSRIAVAPALGGAVVTAYQTTGTGLRLAGWWPDGGGLLFWEDPDYSASIAADGLMLYSLPAGAARPIGLVQTLVGASWWMPGPNDTIAVVAGGGRSVWEPGRDVDLCSPVTASCRSASIPPHTVGLAPSWSSTGTLLFSVAAAVGPPGDLVGPWDPTTMARWDATNVLWAWPASGSARPVRSVPTGAVLCVPADRSGAALVVARDDLWLVEPATSSRPTRVAGPLFSTIGPTGYYGEVDWAGTFAWSGAPGPRSGQVVHEILAGPNPELP